MRCQVDVGHRGDLFLGRLAFSWQQVDHPAQKLETIWARGVQRVAACLEP